MAPQLLLVGGGERAVQQVRLAVPQLPEGGADVRLEVIPLQTEFLVRLHCAARWCGRCVDTMRCSPLRIFVPPIAALHSTQPALLNLNLYIAL